MNIDTQINQIVQQVIADLKREVQEGLDNEPANTKRKVKRSKGLRYD